MSLIIEVLHAYIVYSQSAVTAFYLVQYSQSALEHVKRH